MRSSAGEVCSGGGSSRTTAFIICKRRRPAKRTTPGEHFVEDGTEAEDVRPHIDRSALGLLRRHVGRRAQHDAVLRLRDIGIHADEPGQAEIEQLGHAPVDVRDQSPCVAGLQVAVKNALSVCLLEAFAICRAMRRTSSCGSQVHATADRSASVCPSTYSSTR